jgi:hypothetical protein
LPPYSGILPPSDGVNAIKRMIKVIDEFIPEKIAMQNTLVQGKDEKGQNIFKNEEDKRKYDDIQKDIKYLERINGVILFGL